MIPLRSPLMQSVHQEDTGPAAAQPGPDPRLTAEEYAAWLLPPRPRDATEKVVHALSLAAGVIAVTGGLGALWWIL